MEKAKNKAFISRYFNALSGVTKTRQLLEEYVTDEKLIAHIGFYDKVFLNYEIFADEMMAEDNKVIVRARVKGVHEGEIKGILPTHRKVEFPFVICYTIENGKISDHWIISDQMTILEQLGVMNMPV